MPTFAVLWCAARGKETDEDKRETRKKRFSFSFFRLRREKICDSLTIDLRKWGDLYVVTELQEEQRRKSHVSCFDGVNHVPSWYFERDCDLIHAFYRFCILFNTNFILLFHSTFLQCDRKNRFCIKIAV